LDKHGLLLINVVLYSANDMMLWISRFNIKLST